MICGNKSALGTSVFQALKIVPDVVATMKKEGKVMTELWNE